MLCPLLKNTQLSREGNNYKRNEVRRLCYILVNRSGSHFAPVDETVIRLVIRCKQVEWLREEGDEQDEEIEQKLKEAAPNDKEVAKKMLGMSIDDGGESSLSVNEVSAKVTKEKPTVPAPRRKKNRTASSKETPNTNGAHGSNELKVPAAHVHEASSADEGGKSPFADDMAEEP